MICLYVRLSIEDDVSGSAFKTESGSITTQRALLHDYIKNRKEFKGCKVIEKYDDGFSGTLRQQTAVRVNDNYDSAELAEGTTGSLDVAFKNLIYDYYSREMSRKQRIAWQRMAEQGQYNSTCALYGYRKSKEDKHKLVIEPEEAEVVR